MMDLLSSNQMRRPPMDDDEFQRFYDSYRRQEEVLHRPLIRQMERQEFDEQVHLNILILVRLPILHDHIDNLTRFYRDIARTCTDNLNGRPVRLSRRKANELFETLLQTYLRDPGRNITAHDRTVLWDVIRPN
jgi:hypothetical protein